MGNPKALTSIYICCVPTVKAEAIKGLVEIC